MTIGKPILRVGKIKRSGRCCITSVDNHLSRTMPTANADPARTGGNEWLVGGPGQLAAGVAHVMERAGLTDAKLRTDATVANDILLSISPTWFRPNDPDAAGIWDQAKLDVFRAEALAFLQQQFGPRLVGAVLHLDESTPHVQAIIVPVMKRGDGHRLSGRDYFNPERLTKLQDAWEKRLEPHGVGPREVGSTATHTTIKSYYSALQRAPRVPLIGPPDPPPMRAMLPGGAAAMAEWQGNEVAKVKRRQKPLAAAAAKGMLYEAEKAAGDTMRHQAADQAARLARMHADLAQVKQDLAVTKDQVAVLRGVPVAEVAAVLGYAGEVGRKENAIDLVKRIGGLSFEDAVRWMAYAFNPAAAGAAVRTDATRPVDVLDVPLTKADKVKAGAMWKQLKALDAPAYRVTVVHVRADGTKYGINFGRAKLEDTERTWTADEVIGLVPRLTVENARGGHVYVTPLDERVHHALIDDLSTEDVQHLKGIGYAFSTVVETSPGNHQAVVKVLSDGVPHEAVNEWFKALNREFGDERITGVEHTMRMAGFQNRKAKHAQADGHFPFVRLVEAARTFCAHARAVITDMAKQMTAGSKPAP